MSQAPSVGQPPAGRCLQLSGVDWETYSRLLRAFAERPGTLIVIAPLMVVFLLFQRLFIESFTQSGLKG